MLLENYRPRSMLVTQKTPIDRPRFPVIDAHNHLSQGFGDWLKKPVGALLEAMDQSHVEVYVDLDGGWGEDILQKHLEHFKAAAPQRFLHAAGVDWSGWEQHGDRFGDWAAHRLRLQAGWGAQILKVWKVLGTQVRDQNQALVMPDDPRLHPVWETAGELNLPVVVHVADPVAFFEPLDETNERWEELQGHPSWQFPSPPFPPFLEIVSAMARVVERFPQTTFVGAHVGWYAEDLAWVGDLLARCPNFYVDIGRASPSWDASPTAPEDFSCSTPTASCLAQMLAHGRSFTGFTTASSRRRMNILITTRAKFPGRGAGRFTGCICQMRCWIRFTVKMRRRFLKSEARAARSVSM
jgi:hypothetical protein